MSVAEQSAPPSSIRVIEHQERQTVTQRFLTATVLTFSLATGSPAQPTPRDAVDALLDVMRRRLLVMPAVAAAKSRAGQPIEDLKREREVLDAAVRQGKEA